MPEQEHPLLAKVLPLAETLVREEHFSVENLCRTLDLSLRELAEAFPAVDLLHVHMYARYLAAFTERGRALSQAEADHGKAVEALAVAWLEHAFDQPAMMASMLQHKWEPGFTRPDWYVQTIEGCFQVMVERLARFAPGQPAAVCGATARGIFSLVTGLHFLILNDRTTLLGIEDARRLVRLQVGLLLDGLKSRG